MVAAGRDHPLTTVTYERDGIPRPVMKVKVSDPSQRSTVEMMTKVDTGFDGGLLIPLDQYIQLRLQEFEEPSGNFVGHSAQGITVSLRSSRGVVSVEGTRNECTIYSTPLLLRPLLGRELLNRWRVTLDGPRSELTVH